MKQNVTILESRNSAIHSHGGPGAMIGEVTLVVEVADAAPHHITIERVEYLTRSCNTDAWQSRTPVAVASHALSSWTPVATLATSDGATAGITLPAAAPPQKYRVHAKFAKPFEAYNACEVFAFDVDVEVDGARTKRLVPLDVEREENLRD